MNKKDIVLGSYAHGETIDCMYMRTITTDGKEMFGNLANSEWERYLLEAIVYRKIVIPKGKKVYKTKIHKEEKQIRHDDDKMKITSYNVIGTVYYQ